MVEIRALKSGYEKPRGILLGNDHLEPLGHACMCEHTYVALNSNL